MTSPQTLLDGPDGRVRLWETAIAPAHASAWLEALLESVPWQTEHITMFGKTHEVPRRVAWFGDAGATYRYAGVQHEPLPWSPLLAQIRAEVHRLLPDHLFNSVLLNCYRNGRDRMGWHADNEPELGRNPVIASVSLGATRRFDLKHRVTGEKVQFPLHSGSLLVMDGPLQHHWLHQLPATAKVHAPRVNLTFRCVR
jgi:alkylated DNA repair dioxygenase AlkB